MENFNIPVPQKIEKSEIIIDNFAEPEPSLEKTIADVFQQMSFSHLEPEVIEEINSLDGPDELKTIFQEMLIAEQKREYIRKQLNKFESYKRRYQILLKELDKAFKNNVKSFEYLCYQSCRYRDAPSSEEEVLQSYRKNYIENSQIDKLFIDNKSFFPIM